MESERHAFTDFPESKYLGCHLLQADQQIYNQPPTHRHKASNPGSLDTRKISNLSVRSHRGFSLLGANTHQQPYLSADGKSSHAKTTRMMAEPSNPQVFQTNNGLDHIFDQKSYPRLETGHYFSSQSTRPGPNLRIQPPNHYNNPPTNSMLSPPLPSGSSSAISYFGQNSIRASQYTPNLSSSFVSPCSDSIFPATHPEQFSSQLPAFFASTFSGNSSENLCQSVLHNSTFVSSVSPPESACYLPPASHYQLSQAHPTRFYSHCPTSAFQPAPVAHIPRSFVSTSDYANLPANNTKRSLQVYSSSSSENSQQVIFSLPTKHPKPTLVIPNHQGVFDHRHIHLHSDEPFKVENSSDLNSPNCLVFPCAKQEPDPDFESFPISLELFGSHQARMTNHKSNQKSANASNHNLVGHRIDDGRLELMSVLGLGAYGVVYLARDLSSPDKDHPKLYAVKALNKIGLDARQKAFQRREIALHSLASSHASIVTLHAVIESPSCIFVILDYCPDGDLFGMITEKQKYLGKNDAIKSVFVQIIEAVQFCHRLGISHRDLKPENILCKKGGDEVVLADFGLATAERTSTDFGCGSTFYMSPECQGGLFQKLGCYSTIHNDVWSLGVILVNLTCGRNPWKQACPSDETFRAYLANPEFLRSILPISLPLNHLLKRIFSLNPLARISLEDMKVELMKIKNFNMTAEELSKSTRATREAARAWFPDVPPSPKPHPNGEASSWKNTFSKRNKKPVRSRHEDCENSRRNVLDANGDVWNQPVRYEDSSSSGSATTAYNASNDSSAWSLNGPQPNLHQKQLWKQIKSPFHGLSASREPDQPSRNRFFGPQNAPKNQNTAPSNKKEQASEVQVPTGPLVTAFTSASISKYSSSSSQERSKKTRGFSARFGSLKQSASPNRGSASPPNSSASRRKLLVKPTTFNRPNAPAPIVLKPCTPESSDSSASSRSRGVITPTNGKGKHMNLSFLPSTPPSSASPSSSTFGFIKRTTKFFPFSGHSDLPPTPSTPTHPGKDSNSSTPPRNSRSPAPASIRKAFESKKFPFFGSSDSDGQEATDAVFGVEVEEALNKYNGNRIVSRSDPKLKRVSPSLIPVSVPR